jgi:hypothetical protein
MMVHTLKESKDINLHTFACNPGFVTGVNPQHDDFPLKPDDGATRVLYPILKFYSDDPLPKEWIVVKDYKEGKI